MALKIFDHLVVGPISCNCYLVGDDASKKAIVIDPGDQPQDILDSIERNQLEVVAVVATHAHFDHVLGADLLREKLGVSFYLHSDDIPILESLQERGMKFLGIELPPPPEVDRRYADGDELSAGELRLQVISTPGHSPGSVSLLVPDQAVFSGDTLFNRSIGRTDLPGGDQDQELKSIKDKLFVLDDLPVYPGHGPQTTIDQEKVGNPFVGKRSRIWTPD